MPLPSLKYGLHQKSSLFQHTSSSLDQIPLSITSASTFQSSIIHNPAALKLAALCCAVGVAIGTTAATVSVSVPTIQSATPSQSTQELSEDSSLWTPIIAIGGTAVTKGYCWSCDHGEWTSWWYGQCGACSGGWGGSCCDVPNVSVDDRWLQYLEVASDGVVGEADELEIFAKEVVRGLSGGIPAASSSLMDVDIVVSGGGNFDAFYLGMQLVMDELRASDVNVQRYGGVSAGGMMPYEVALKGTRKTLENHLSYAQLVSEYKDYFSNAVSEMYMQDHLWRIMADWQMRAYGGVLSEKLNGVVFVGITCLKPLPVQVTVGEYTVEGGQAGSAFMATGTVLEIYDGYICSDGGATAGANMTPLFQDGLRDQIIVDLMATGYPSDMVYSVEREEYVSLIKEGMEEMGRWLKDGVTEREGIITRCEVGKDVLNNICI